jgi:uncharacterized protein YabN with tetrapyrrole methylase and pyrophosphatase domain
MANYDRIDLMNFVRYGNDIDDQWDEIRNYIKSNAGAQREVDEIRKTLPQSSQAARRKMESFEPQSYSSKLQDVPPSTPNKGEVNTPKEKNQKWWNKILGDE